LIDEYWITLDFLWNPTTNHQCNLQKVDACRSELMDDHNDIIISRFENKLQLLNCSQEILNIIYDIEQLTPNSETDF
jgi:hypothetical protein